MITKWGMDETFISCDCDAEVLRIKYEPYINPEDGSVVGDEHFMDLDIAIYSLPGATWTLRNKLRCIWHMMKTGRPFNDQILLDREQVIKLRDTLNNFIEHKPNEETK